jgi:hypothetical protein
MHQQHNPHADQYSAQKNRLSQPFVKSGANRELIIFLAMIGDAACCAASSSTASAASIVNTPEVFNSSLTRSTVPRKQYPCRGIVRRISQGQPQFIYGGIYVGVIIHKRAVWPQPRAQRLAGHNFAGPFNEYQQDLEHFGRDADSRSFLKQLLALRINLKLVKTQIPFRCLRFAQLLSASA